MRKFRAPHCLDEKRTFLETAGAIRTLKDLVWGWRGALTLGVHPPNLHFNLAKLREAERPNGATLARWSFSWQTLVLHLPARGRVI